MKLFKKIRKGFTLIELVVVIAVIAILSAVSILSYVAITNNAKKSSDEQAVRQMNTCLAAKEITGAKDITELFSILEEEGMSAKNYKPLTKDTFFFWDKEDNRIVYAKYDANTKKYVGIFPEQYKDKNKGSHHWYSLSQEIKTVSVAKQTSGFYSLQSAEELYTVLTDTANYAPTSITLSNDIDLMGADINFTGVTNFDGNGNTISGLSQLKSNFVDTNEGSNQGQAYRSGLFPLVNTDTVISNLNIEHTIVGSYDTGNVGLVCGIIRDGATVTMSHVTISDCTVYGRQKAGTFAGQVAGNSKLILDNTCSATNVDIWTVQGECGKLIGGAANKSKITSSATLTNVKLHRGPNHDEIQFTEAIADSAANINEVKVGSGYLVKGGDDTSYRFFNENAILTVINNAKITYNDTDYKATGAEGNATIGAKTVTTKGCVPLILE